MALANIITPIYLSGWQFALPIVGAHATANSCCVAKT